MRCVDALDIGLLFTRESCIEQPDSVCLVINLKCGRSL